MLKKMRDNADSALMKTFLGVLALSFVGWGVGDYLNGGYNSTAIRVNGEKISIQEVSKEYNSAVKSVEQRFGNAVTPDAARQLGITQNVLRSLIQESAVDQFANEIDLRISDAQLHEMITSNTAFQNENGEFSENMYKNKLRSAGFTTEGYENALRKTALRSSLIDMFSAPLTNNHTLDTYLDFTTERMDVQILEVKRSNIESPTPTSDEEIQNYYNLNKHNFNTEETRDFTLVELTLNALKDKIEISEAAAKEVYETDADSFISEETRQISHILLNTEEDAIRIADILDKDGSDFSKIAEQNSTDVFSKNKGGDLGSTKKGDMEEEFSTIAFSLSKGDISEPIQTSFGWHIIRVTDISESKKLSFTEAQESIVDELKIEQAEDQYYSVMERLEDALAGGSDLLEMAKELGLENKTFVDTKFSTASFKHAELALPSAFELNEGETSDALQLNGEEGQVYVQLNKVTPARPLEISEAKADILKAITEQKISKAVNEQAAELLMARKDGAELKRIAQNHGLKKNLTTVKNISIQGENAPVWMDQKVMHRLIVKNPGQTVDKIIPTQSGYAIVELKDRYQDEVSEEVETAIENALTFEMNQDLQAQFLQELLNNAEIESNDALLKNTLGAAYISEKTGLSGDPLAQSF